MIEEMRLRDLGVIAEATLPIGPGFTAITGETGAGKTMVVTGLGLLLGQRADSGAVRSGAAQASVDGVWIVPEDGPVAERVREAGGDVEPLGDGTRRAVRRPLDLERGPRPRDRRRSRRARRRARRPRRRARRRARPVRPAAAALGHGAARRARPLRRRRRCSPRATPTATRSSAGARSSASSPTLTTDRDARAARGRASCASSSPRSSRPRRSPARTPSSPSRAERLANAEELRLAAATAHDALSGDGDAPDAGTLLAEARRALERAHDPALDDLAAQVADLGYRAAGSRRRARRLPRRPRRDRARTSSPPSRSAARCSAALVRAHGTLDAAIELLDTGSARLAELDDDGDRIERLTARAGCRGIRSRRRRRRADRGAHRRGRAARRARSPPSCALSRCPTRGSTVAVTPGAETAAGRDDVAILLVAAHRRRSAPGRRAARRAASSAA